MERWGMIAVMLVITGLGHCGWLDTVGDFRGAGLPPGGAPTHGGARVVTGWEDTPSPGGSPAPRGLGSTTLCAQGWVLRDLGTLGGRFSFAFSINRVGQVVGQAKTALARHHPFLHTGGGVLHDLGTLGGEMGEARAINARGDIAGSAAVARGPYHAFRYRQGRLTDLGTLGGASSQAFGINDSGEVVGQSDTSAGPHAFLYQGGVLRDLGTLAGGSSSQAHAINNSGQIVGWSSTGRMDPASNSADQQAFLYDHGVMRGLGTLGGVASIAYDINDADHVVGEAETSRGARHAFLYRRGALRDLGTLGGSRSSASAINAYDHVVGQSQTRSGVTHAFVYSAGTMKDLNDLLPPNSGWVLTIATDINGAGVIVGAGTYGGERRAFVLSPRPPAQRRAAAT